MPSTSSGSGPTPSASTHPEEDAEIASSPSPSTSAPASTDLVARRPYQLSVPASDGGALPLVILIHGYGSSGEGHESYFGGLARITKARGIILAVPNGTYDHKRMLFWNATEACCDFDKLPIDDVAYLDAIVEDVAKKAPLDRSRVYALGHSNGAFMAHRWACERPNEVAAIVALAGVPWSDPARCAGHDVSVLQVHGDADKVIDYAGGKSFGNGEPYPGAEAAIAAWASRDGCGQARHSLGPPVDFDLAVPGPETTREAYDCPKGLAVELWRMRGSSHVPRFDARFANAALDFLLAHRAERR